MSTAAPRRRSGVITSGALLALLAGQAVVLQAAPAGAEPVHLTVGSLKVDDSAAPLGVADETPRFSWQLTTPTRAVLEKSYEVQVGTDAQALASGRADVWDSGVQPSDRVADIAYAGPKLDSARRYYWRVKVATDRAGAAWSDVSQFTTGLVSDQDKHAQWIGEAGQSSQDWSDYTVNADVQVVAETAALYLRAHGTASSYMWQLAIEGDHLAIKPHVRVNGSYDVLADIPVPTSLVPTTDLHTTHHLKISAIGSQITTWLDGTQVDQRTDTRYATGAIGFRATSTERARWSNMSVTSEPDGASLFTDALDANPFSAGSSGADGLTVTNASPILATPGSATWSDYRVDVDVTIGEEAATLYLRSDSTGANSYMWQLNATGGDGLVFKPHQRVNGGYQVLDEVPISQDVVPASTIHDTHHLTVELSGQHIVTSIDGHQVDARDLGTFDHGTLGMRQSPTESATFSDLKVVSGSGVTLLDNTLRTREPFGIGSYEGGVLEVSDADVVLHDDVIPTPLVRHEFDLQQPADHVARALLFSTAKGVYGAEINGAFVNDDRLSPGSSDYRQEIYYQTSDVTDLLRSGENAVAAQVAPGWYAGNIGWFGPNQFGTTPQFWGQLEITFDDGTTQRVSTGPDWKVGSGGLQSADILDGESLDLRQVPTGWDEPGFDDSSWSDVKATAPDTAILKAQVGPTIRPTGEIEPVARKEVKPGVYVFDLGQEISGVVRMTVDGPESQEVTLRHAQDVTSTGELYTDNLNAGSPAYRARQTDHVVLDGSGPTTFEPRYTYHGFRYFEVTGYPGVPELSDFRGVSLGTDVERIGDVTTGDQMLDQLQSNITWSVRNNLMSIPTDTNARAERLGWAGDATFSAASASYNYDLAEFYRKWMHDLVSTQQPSGLVNNVAPSWPAVDGGGYGGGWGDAVVAIPYTSWQRYGDESIVSDNYEAMKKWLLYLEQRSNGTYRLDGSLGPAGDWMNAGEGTEGAYTATGYFGWDAKVMAQMATALGKTADATRFDQIHASISQAMVDAGWIKPNGVVEPNTQTAYVMALYADLVPADLRQAAGDRLTANIEARGVHLSTGFVGTGWLLPVLDDLGRTDLAYGLAQQTSYPSWGYMVDQGATTIWERWDYTLPDSGTFNPNILGSSDDHGVFGSVGSWMYDTIGGIAQDPEHPGYRQFSIDPQPGGTITHGEGSFESRYGTISTSWTASGENGRFALDATIPAGSTAVVSIPVKPGEAAREGGKLAGQAEGVAYRGTADGKATYLVGSGTYSFTIGDAPVAAPAPIGRLSTTVTSTNKPLALSLVFDQPVTGLSRTDVVVTNGSVTAMTGSGRSYTVRVRPDRTGRVGVSVPANAVVNSDGVGNVAVPAISVTYAPARTTVGVHVVKKPSTRKKGRLSLVVTSARGTPSGVVTVTLTSKGKKAVTRRVALRGGTGALVLPRLKAGRWKVTATYAATTSATGAYAGSAKAVTFTIRRSH